MPFESETPKMRKKILFWAGSDYACYPELKEKTRK